jgi:hypothetical protein
VQLASILKVSTDELFARPRTTGAELEISDVRLLDKFQRLQRLNKRDREAVITLIDGVLASRAVESAIASARFISSLTMSWRHHGAMHARSRGRVGGRWR